MTDVAGVKAPADGASSPSPASWGAIPWPGPSRWASTGPTLSCSSGATWVLTPTASTDPDAYARLQSVVTQLGAEVLALSPEQHDTLVAMVSHVPHLTAATLMNLADRAAEEHGALLRLAAGGFRDMTRIAAGQPGIWPDVCAENAPAIVAALDTLLADLSGMRDRVAAADKAGLLAELEHAAAARRSLPARAVRPERLAELRVPVPDRPGVLAEITTLAGDLGVNIHDIELAHSVEGDRGVLVLVVDGDVVAPAARRPHRSRLPVDVRGISNEPDPGSGDRPRPTTTRVFTVEGGRPLRGRVRVPGDKSVSHRALLLGALAAGGVGGAGPVRRRRRGPHRRRAARPGGAARERRPAGVDDDHRADAAGLREPAGPLDIGNSGTTMRLLAGVVAGLAFTTRAHGRHVVVGPAHGPGGRAAAAHGGDGRRVGERCLPPLTIRGGALQGIDYTTPMASAQVKSCVLLAGLAAEGETVVREPVLTRRHTEELLARCGARVSETDDARRRPRRASRAPRSWPPFELDVPGDPSQAAFWVVAACVVPGSEVTVAARLRRDRAARLPGRAGPHGGEHRRGARPPGPVTWPPPPTSSPASARCRRPRSTPPRSRASTRSPSWPWRRRARRVTRCSATWGSSG